MLIKYKVNKWIKMYYSSAHMYNIMIVYKDS